MSVRTTADEKLDEAREHIQKAIEALSRVVVDRCHGTDDYSSTHREMTEQAFDRLRDARKMLEFGR